MSWKGLTAPYRYLICSGNDLNPARFHHWNEWAIAERKIPINFHSPDLVIRMRHHFRPLLCHHSHRPSRFRPLLQPPVRCGMTQWNTASADDCTSRKSASFETTGQWPKVVQASGLGQNGSRNFKMCMGTAVSMAFLI